MSVGRKMRMQALAVDVAGNPQAHVPLKVEAIHHTTTSTRKRLVGGFIAMTTSAAANRWARCAAARAMRAACCCAKCRCWRLERSN